MEAQKAAIGARIRSARKSHGWSQEELARRAGVAAGTVSRVEGGDHVRPGNLFSIRVALGIESDEPEDAAELPPSVQLALDIVKKWLLAQPNPKAVDQAAHELTAWVVQRF